jgi:hypothetical protein
MLIVVLRISEGSNYYINAWLPNLVLLDVGFFALL